MMRHAAITVLNGGRLKEPRVPAVVITPHSHHSA